ncbi:MAG: radical SAM peptide maturase, CXXX-repeat target family [Clostridium sp.]|uniref:radical SAM peptide maturase, CXXX-repeat target family n=1 Tax=Clostridium sp. TaxID=1506 RepID=UPI003EE712B9
MVANSGVNTKKSQEFGDTFMDYMFAKADIEGYKRKQTYPAKTITFQVTEACNLKCSYCYQINKSNSALTLDKAKKFIDMLIKDSYNKDSYVYIEDTPAIVIDFIGGEPLLEIDLINDITEYFKYTTIKHKHIWSKNYMISIISNGVLYFKDEVQSYIERNKDKLSFSISLDGCKELHDMCRVFDNGRGSYDLAERACLDYMNRYNPLMSTKLTIAPENITWVYKAMLNLYDLGYEIINANCVYEEGWNENDAVVLYEEMKKVADFVIDNNLEHKLYISLFDENLFKPVPIEDNHNYCGTTGSMLSLAHTGDIYSCIRFMSSSLGDDVKPFAIGNIDDGIGKRVEHKDKIDILGEVTRRSQSTDKCYNCSVGGGCGHCTAYNYQKFGTPDKKATYICDMHKSRSLANVYYWNKVYQKNGENKRFKMYLSKEDALKYIDINEYDMLYQLQD